VIVLDASAAVVALLNDGHARRSLATGTVAVPHLVDSEIVSASELSVCGARSVRTTPAPRSRAGRSSACAGFR